jgi:4-amino-4-deoxy-L-arabinose transferase-like glycosyltransferase
MDDPLFLWAGRQMQTQWWDPYGVPVNWYGWPMPLHEVTKNPPLASAFIALLISIFGESEFVLHLGFCLPAIAFILGTYALGRRFCDHPLPAALAALFTPVFIVSSTGLMCDVWMVALWVWAIVFWLRGLEKDQPLLLLLGAFLISACSLAKYFGIALIPLLLVYTWWRKHKPGWWLAWFLVPIAMMGLYEAITRGLYGHGLFLDAFSYAHEHQMGTILPKLLTVLGFIGGCCAIVLVLLPMLWRPHWWIVASITLLFLSGTTWILSDSLGGYMESSARVNVTVLCTLLAFGGLVVLLLPILDWKLHKNADTVLLLLWVWGVFAFSVLNWTINGRSVLPMVPAVAILLLRRIEFIKRATPFRMNMAFATAAILSLLVAFADYRLANSARAAVGEIQTKFGHASAAPIWFQGHWGFQYYAEKSGLRPFDFKNPQAQAGDLMVIPYTNTNITTLPKEIVDPVATIEMPVTPWIATMSYEMGAGFYTDIVGPLPFSFGTIPAGKYYLFRFK